MSTETPTKKLTKRDFAAETPRWCPGCGDFAVLSTMQKVFATLGIPKEKVVVVSGIGCSSRFPYYMDTYGFHTIHGRAPTVATGIKLANPDLSVWVITGDGDGLSIGGNHLLHAMRRNLNINVVLFNNHVYALTKGQFSPTSQQGRVTKTSPEGAIDYPIEPVIFALGAEATFVARTADTMSQHMERTLLEAARHEGTSFVEILQHCVIFDHHGWEHLTGRDVRDDRLILLEEGHPITFGKEPKKGIRSTGESLEVVDLESDDYSEEDLLVHDSTTRNYLYSRMIARMNHPDFPVPLGVIRSVKERQTYEDALKIKLDHAAEKRPPEDIESLIQGADSWVVE
jgi:2-oxoglutarate ferredoxin oxidoreductase subunit beta